MNENFSPSVTTRRRSQQANISFMYPTCEVSKDDKSSDGSLEQQENIDHMFST